MFGACSHACAGPARVQSGLGNRSGIDQRRGAVKMKTRRPSRLARVRVIILLTIPVCGYLLPGVSVAETSISGRVVEFKTNNGLRDIRIKLRLRDRDRPEAETTTSSDGS